MTKTKKLIASLVLVAVGCVAACIPKSIVKTAADVAIEACRFTYGQNPKDLPAGLTAEEFCKTAENYQPFIDTLLSVEKMQAVKMGTRKPDVDAGQ